MKPSTVLVTFALFIEASLATATDQVTDVQGREVPGDINSEPGTGVSELVKRGSNADWSRHAQSYRRNVEIWTDIALTVEKALPRVYMPSAYCQTRNKAFDISEQCTYCCDCTAQGQFQCTGNGLTGDALKNNCGADLGALYKKCSEKVGGFLGIGGTPRCECRKNPFA